MSDLKRVLALKPPFPWTTVKLWKDRQEASSVAVFDSSVAVAARNHWEWSTHAYAIAMRSSEYHLLSQSTICAVTHLFALLCLLLFDQELRPMAVFLWRSIAYDQHGLSARPILSEFVHDVITQKHICRLRMIFYIWRQERERTLPKDQIHVYEVNGSGKPGPWVHNCIFFA